MAIEASRHVAGVCVGSPGEFSTHICPVGYLYSYLWGVIGRSWTWLGVNLNVEPRVAAKKVRPSRNSVATTSMGGWRVGILSSCPDVVHDQVAEESSQVARTFH